MLFTVKDLAAIYKKDGTDNEGLDDEELQDYVQ